MLAGEMNLTRRDRFLIYMGAEAAVCVVSIALFVATQRALLLAAAAGGLIGVVVSWRQARQECGATRTGAIIAERARFARIANAAEQIARDAAKDPGGYSDGAEGFRWAAEHIRQAIREAT